MNVPLLRLLLLAALLCPAPLPAQSPEDRPRWHVSAGGGRITSGAYFTGPGDLELASAGSAAALAQVSLAFHPRLSAVLAAAYARPEFELTGVPLAGTVGVPGASLWFADASVRGWAPLGDRGGAPAAFLSLGLGLARYSLETSLLGVAVDERATNVALALGAGLVLPIVSRVGVEVTARDYVASFRSVRDLEDFGVEGRRAHTILLAVSARVGL